MPSIDFVTSIPSGNRSGGWDGANAGLFAGLEQLAAVAYVGPIDPPVDLRAKLMSKALRLARLPGAFHFFSRARLAAIAAEYEARKSVSATRTLFFGCTPWVRCRPSSEYFVYTDCVFHTYIRRYHDAHAFGSADVARIEAAEARWLEGAAGVFVSTEWGASEAQQAYGLNRKTLRAVGMGGNVEPPRDAGDPEGVRLLFIAYDFEKKGGGVCLETLGRLRALGIDATLVTIGGAPPREALENAHVEHLGVLRKTEPSEAARYLRELTRAFLVLHPSTADIGSAAILEAAYYGCPAVAPKACCYVDQVIDGETGMLFPPPLSSEAIAARIAELVRDERRYRAMRMAARRFSLERFTWPGTARSVLEIMGGGRKAPVTARPDGTAKSEPR